DARFHGLIEILTQNQFKMIRQTDIIHIEPPVQIGETLQGDLIYPIKEIRTNEARMENLVKLCKRYIQKRIPITPLQTYRSRAGGMPYWTDCWKNIAMSW